MLTPAPSNANRIKEIRRRPRGTTPTGGASEPSGTFSQLSSAPAFPTPSFSAPTNQPGGFSFGQSQSFPGASTTPSQPTQGSAAPFSFGGNGSSFNFSGGFGSPASNPFANSPFSAGNSAPAAQPTSTTGSASFGGFGSQPTPKPAFSFGAPQNAGTSVGTGLFGQPAATNANGNPVADSMQTSPDAKPKTSFAPSASFPSKNLFGDSGAPNLFSPKPAAPAGNPFGGLSFPPPEKPSSDKAEGFAAKPAFASQAPTSTSQAPPFGSLFGAAPATSTPSEPEKPATNNVFAPKATAPAPASASSNPFMFKPAASEPEKANATQVASNNIFSPKPPAEQSTSTNIFASKPAEQTSTPSLFAAKAPANDAASTTAPAQPFKNIFGAASTAQSTASKPATEQASTTNMFAPKAVTEQNFEKPAEPKPFGSLFGTPKPAADQSLSKSAETNPFGSIFGAASTTSKPAELATPSLFTPKPAVAQAPEKPTEAAQPFKNIFGTPSTAPKPAEPAQAPSLFTPKPATEQAAPSPAKPFANLLGGKTATPQPTPVKPSTAAPSGLASIQKPEAPEAISKPNITAGTNKVVAETAELLWKIRGLDTHFKQEVMKYKPGTDSFDDLILFYIRVRNGMGAPIKGAPEPLVKKAAEKSVHIDGPNGSATSSVFAESFSSPTPNTAPPVPVSAPAPSATGNMFSKSLSNGTVASPAPAASLAPKPAGNMFAQAASAKTPNGSAAPAPALAPPKFGNGVGTVDFMAQFKQKAEKTLAEEKAKRKAEDFDSDSDDEEEWERQYAEKQKEKRAKLEIGSQKKSVFRNGKFEWVDAEEPDSVETGGNAVKPAEKPSANSLFVPADNSVLSAPSPASSTASIFETSGRPLPHPRISLVVLPRSPTMLTRTATSLMMRARLILQSALRKKMSVRMTILHPLCATPSAPSLPRILIPRSPAWTHLFLRRLRLPVAVCLIGFSPLPQLPKRRPPHLLRASSRLASASRLPLASPSPLAKTTPRQQRTRPGNPTRQSNSLLTPRWLLQLLRRLWLLPSHPAAPILETPPLMRKLPLVKFSTCPKPMRARKMKRWSLNVVPEHSSWPLAGHPRVPVFYACLDTRRLSVPVSSSVPIPVAMSS